MNEYHKSIDQDFVDIIRDNLFKENRMNKLSGERIYLRKLNEWF